jgi:hypothetical protein
LGIVNFGIPMEEAIHLKDVMGLSVAAEGGTFQGDTAKELSKFFDRVYTVENSDKMFVQAEENLAHVNNVVLLKGDTRAHLPEILDAEDEILFWLDAHWSGGDTYGEEDECPLLDELGLIFGSGKRCAILVDDARLFMAPPPAPHDQALWPSIADIVAITPSDWDFIIWKDVIFVTPKQVGFRGYVQRKLSLESATRDKGLRAGLARLFSRVARVLSEKPG